MKYKRKEGFIDMDFDGIDSFLEEMNDSEVELTEADEAAIVLAAIESECTPEEYQLVLENIHELEIYGIIPNAEIVTEAKKIVYKQTKQMNMSREKARAALRIAERKNTGAWKRYHAARQKMLEAREEIYKQHNAEATKTAKNVLSNARKKASSMKGQTVTGDMIYNKIRAKQKKINGKAS